MDAKGVFTRRDPASLEIGESPVAAYHIGQAERMIDGIDVMLLCGSSADDIEDHGPHFASMFNIVDSYDTHAKIPQYLASVDAVAKNTTAIISTGWDPGLFSILRVISTSVLPDGASYTFWGSGVSQGHSAAIRGIEGVKDAVQYTIPINEAVDAVRSGSMPKLDAQSMHQRVCYVVAEPGADKAKIEKSIKTMPHYFADYHTFVNFIDDYSFISEHSGMPHGGKELRTGKTGGKGQHTHSIEFSLDLDSNPEFTGSVMTAYARAAFRMSREGLFGAKTVFDVPLSYISVMDRATLIKELL